MRPVSTRTIALPRLNRLEPTLEGTALKLMEEAGELAKTILGLTEEGRQGPALSRVALDLLDVAQTAITMMYVLEEQYKVDVGGALERHLAKLMARGYLSLDDDDIPAKEGEVGQSVEMGQALSRPKE